MTSAGPDSLSPFPCVRVQSVLYNLTLDRIERALEYLDNAVAIARKANLVKQVVVAYGDCSPRRTLAAADLSRLRKGCRNLDRLDYTFFDANLGSAAGHNRLLAEAASDFVMIMNPDVLAAPNLFAELFAALSRPQVGLVEARQAPIEHPKDYDPDTGETSWASTACAIGPLTLFRQLDGFDSDTFFLYCDDVDFSWRVRLSGYKVVHQDSAVVFHDKQVSREGAWQAGDAEKYYAAEAGLLLPYKYSRPDLVEQALSYFERSEDPALLKAAGAFEMRKKAGRLPEPIDPEGSVAQFIGGNYAQHRF